MWQIEDDSVEIRISPKDSNEQRPVASADVDQLPKGREIIRCGNRGGSDRREGGHRLIEDFRLFWIRRDTGERICVWRLAAKPGLAGPNAILKFLPGILHTGAGE